MTFTYLGDINPFGVPDFVAMSREHYMRRFCALLLSACCTLFQTVGCFANPTTVTLEEGTPIRVKLEESLSTKTSCAGQKLQLSVVEDIAGKDGKTTVIKAGSPATGYLTSLDEQEGSKGGKLTIEITSVKAIDGTRVSLRGMRGKSGSGGAGVGSYALGYLFGGVLGIGLVALCGKGKHAEIPAGTVLTAFVDRDSTVSIAPSTDTEVIIKSVNVSSVTTESPPASNAAPSEKGSGNAPETPVIKQADSNKPDD